MKVRVALFMVAAMVASVAGGTSAGAHQVAMPGSCQSGYLCVHWDSHGHGQKFIFAEQNHSWNHCGVWHPEGPDEHCWAINDDDSSSWNQKFSGPSNRARIFQNSQQDGWWPAVVCLTPGNWASHHSPNDSGSGNTWPTTCA